MLAAARKRLGSRCAPGGSGGVRPSRPNLGQWRRGDAHRVVAQHRSPALDRVRTMSPLTATPRGRVRRPRLSSVASRPQTTLAKGASVRPSWSLATTAPSAPTGIPARVERPPGITAAEQPRLRAHGREPILIGPHDDDVRAGIDDGVWRHFDRPAGGVRQAVDVDEQILDRPHLAAGLAVEGRVEGGRRDVLAELAGARAEERVDAPPCRLRHRVEGSVGRREQAGLNSHLDERRAADVDLRGDERARRRAPGRPTRTSSADGWGGIASDSATTRTVTAPGTSTPGKSGWRPPRARAFCTPSMAVAKVAKSFSVTARPARRTSLGARLRNAAMSSSSAIRPVGGARVGHLLDARHLRDQRLHRARPRRRCRRRRRRGAISPPRRSRRPAESVRARRRRR